MVGRLLQAVPTPVLVLDLDALDHNLATMAGLFRAGPCALRPHFKSHKCLTIAHRQLQLGARGITCAKLGEAEVLVRGGIPDVLIANQVVATEKLPGLASLAREAWLTVAVDDPQNCTALAAAARQAGSTLGLYIEVDVGLHRCGVRSAPEAVALAQHIATLAHVELRGLLAYEGSLGGLSPEQKARRVEEAMGIALTTKRAIEAVGIPVAEVSAGGTGTWHLTGRYPGVTELQPGGYVHMEQRYQESFQPFRPALSVLATIISQSAEQVILDVGLKALTCDQGLPRLMDDPTVEVLLHEEHGLVPLSLELGKVGIRDRLRLRPSNASTTVNLYDHYVCVRGERVEAVWEIEGRGRSD